MAEANLPLDEYYTSSRLRITIRFDEFANQTVSANIRNKQAANKKTPLRKTGTKDTAATLSMGPDPQAPPGTTRILLGGGGQIVGGPQNQIASGDQYTAVLVGIIPQKASLGLNGARQADTLSVTLRWLDLPVDPRTVRACAVEFYLGTLTAGDFARGVGGENIGSGNLQGRPLNIVKTKYTDIHGNPRTNLRFQGWADVWSVEWSDGEPMVHLECRDNTSILLEQDAPPKLVVPANKPLDQAIAQYLANFPQFAGFSVEYRPQGVTAPVLNDVLSKTAMVKGQGPPPSKGGGAASAGGSSKLAVWDYLTDVCGAVGHLIRVEGTNVIVQRARSYMAETYGRPDDPFQSRLLPSGQTIYNRQMVWGRNIESMKVSRSYNKTAPVNVEVRCYYPERKKVLIARFPTNMNSMQNATPGNTGNEKWTVYRVSGVKDQQTLNIVAQNIYEQLVRNEFQVNLKTKSLGSFGGQNEDPDLLDMIPGDALDVLVNRDEQEFNSQAAIETILLLQDRAKQFMVALGYDEQFAQQYAKAYSNTGMQTTFRVKTVSTTWDVEDGVSFDIACINYLEVRMVDTLSSGELPMGKKK